MLCTRHFVMVTLAAILLLCRPLQATEYFVALHGSDSHEGTSLQKPLASLQKGIDLLKPGDTLTIAPGQYRQSGQREKLGSMALDTTIRAMIPRTVVLRGDVPLTGFAKTPSMRKVYQVPFDQPVQTVNELDTLTVLRSAPNLAELEYVPGSFYYDASKRLLYISGSDWRSPEQSHYSATVTAHDGMWFGNAQRLVIDGLAFTGFNSTMPDRYSPPYRSKFTGMGAVWGVLLTDSQSCAIRNCISYLNGGGIGIEHLVEPSQRGQFPNTIERCTVYGTYSQLFTYETSAIGVYQSNGDQIRSCTAYLNKSFGIRFYLAPWAAGIMDQCLAWGNVHDGDPADLQIKASKDIQVTRSVAMGWATAQSGGYNVLAGEQTVDLPGNIILRPPGKPAVDVDREFVDPVNFDFRLQANSSFRGTSPQGTDAGIASYETNIYFVHPAGADDANGLSIATAWRTLGRALKDRSPGDTIYLFPGTYSSPATVSVAGTQERPVSIRTRGQGTAVIAGDLSLISCDHLNIERLTFTRTLRLEASWNVALRQSVLLGSERSLVAVKSPGLELQNNIFAGFSVAGLEADKGTNQIRCQGNLFDNRSGAAVSLAETASVMYSDYNAFSDTQRAWSISSQSLPWTRVQAHGEMYSRHFKPEFVGNPSSLRVSNAWMVSVAGSMGKPIGCYRDGVMPTTPRLIESPSLHVISATTANVEWLVNQGATCVLQWGTTPECENSDTIDVNYWGTYSLTGLSPSTTYYFRLKSTSAIKSRDATTDPPVTELNTKPLVFRTLAADASAQTYFVSSEGSDEHSGTSREKPWKSLNRAAAMVRPGDTVFIASGRYQERVRIRASGEVERPITFKCMPGHRVIIDGAGKSLSNGFVISSKKHLIFDGLYFVDSSMFPQTGPIVSRAADFLVYRSADIHLSRCYADARNSYAASFVVAHGVKKLLITNCVMIGKFDGIYIERCPELRIEHCVLASPLIYAAIIRNARTEPATMSHNIIVDMLNKKAVQNFGILCVDGYTDLFRMNNNCFYIRCFTPADRKLMNAMNVTEAGELIAGAQFENPGFAGLAALLKAGQRRHEFDPDVLVESPQMLDFNAYFATNPAVIARGIGLQPQAFADFEFSGPAPASR